MNPPLGFLLFGSAFFLIVAAVGVMQARRKKEKTYYGSALVSLLMAPVPILIYINQFLPTILLMASAVLLSIVGWPKISRVLIQEWTKILQESDISTPLRGRDFLTMKGWLKLASRRGVLWTVFLHSLFMMIIFGVALFTLSLWGIVSTLYVTVCTITSTISYAIMFYQQITKALKGSKPSKA